MCRNILGVIYVEIEIKLQFIIVNWKRRNDTLFQVEDGSQLNDRNPR